MCLVAHHHKTNCTVEHSVEAMAYHQCCTTCLWAESFGFTEKTITEEIEDQPRPKIPRVNLIDPQNPFEYYNDDGFFTNYGKKPGSIAVQSFVFKVHSAKT